jgi:hypothetical protein
MTDRAELAGIDPIDRLAILAGALPGAAVRHRRIAAPFDAVWHVIADLEEATPRYEPGVARVHIADRSGRQLQLLVGYTDGREETMEATLRPGWCLMQSATVIVAFAARPLGGQTLLAHLEQLRHHAEGPRHGSPRDRRAARKKLDRELRAVERLATEGTR